MTTLEVILIFVIIVVVSASLYIIKLYRDSNDEMFINWRKDIDAVTELAPKGLFDAVLDVEKFNEWFNSKKDPDIYAHPGIFLRTDKLSQHHFEDYIRMTTNGVLSFDCFTWKQMKKFEDRVLKDWFKKLEEK